MDSILEKYSVFDFFNVVCTGLMFMLGLEIMDVHVFNFMSRLGASNELNTSGGTINAGLYLSTALCGCYLIGSFIQSVSSYVQKKVFRIEEKAIATCLTDKNVIGSAVKLQVYIDEAKRFFASKKIDVVDESFTADQCKYFFAHCVYYIQVKSQDKKTERMRELRGISSMLFLCFTLLIIIGTIVQILACVVNFGDYISHMYWVKIVLIDLLFVVFAIVFWYRTKKATFDRIRMVLGVYDACVIDEARRGVNEEVSAV